MSLRSYFCCLLMVAAGCSQKPRVQMVLVDHIEAVSASSQHPSFAPGLVLDGGSLAENAWHSETRPSFPQWVQVQFPQPVRLHRFRIQSQYNSPSRPTENSRRAPTKLEVWASDDAGFTVHANLGLFHCSYAGPGDWCTNEIAVPIASFRYYRFMILENGGDPDFVTIQEMNFFSEE